MENNWLAFDYTWFRKNQKSLLFFVNNVATKDWFRWILRIHKDVDSKETIIEILPDSYKVFVGYENGKTIIRSDFRTQWVFSKRIYKAFKKLWWGMHYWDELFADRFIQSMSLGYTILTAYPDYHPEINTVDGYVYRMQTGSTWNQLRAGLGTNAVSDLGFFWFGAWSSDFGGGTYLALYRSIFLFNTSPIGASPDVTDAVLSVYYVDMIRSAGGSPSFDVYTSSPASNTDLIPSDYTSLGGTSMTGAPKLWSDLGPAYNDWTFNSIGRANVNKTGISKFGGRMANYDVGVDTPPFVGGGNSTYFSVLAAEHISSHPPKLVVTYSLTGELSIQSTSSLSSEGTIVARRGSFLQSVIY